MVAILYYELAAKFALARKFNGPGKDRK